MHIKTYRYNLFIELWLQLELYHNDYNQPFKLPAFARPRPGRGIFARLAPALAITAALAAAASGTTTAA